MELLLFIQYYTMYYLLLYYFVLSECTLNTRWIVGWRHRLITPRSQQLTCLLGCSKTGLTRAKTATKPSTRCLQRGWNANQTTHTFKHTMTRTLHTHSHTDNEIHSTFFIRIPPTTTTQVLRSRSLRPTQAICFHTMSRHSGRSPFRDNSSHTDATHWYSGWLAIVTINSGFFHGYIFGVQMQSDERRRDETTRSLRDTTKI